MHVSTKAYFAIGHDLLSQGALFGGHQSMTCHLLYILAYNFSEFVLIISAELVITLGQCERCEVRSWAHTFAGIQTIFENNNSIFEMLDQFIGIILFSKTARYGVVEYCGIHRVIIWNKTFIETIFTYKMNCFVWSGNSLAWWFLSQYFP